MSSINVPHRKLLSLIFIISITAFGYSQKKISMSEAEYKREVSMSNSFGKIFRITTFGESHGEALGAIIDGCPAGININIDEIQKELDRRKPGQSKIVTQRKESDTVQILSGVFDGKTTGTSIGLLIKNENQKSKDYEHIKDIYRPSHADFTYDKKYENRDYRGGGRSSAQYP